MKRHLHLLGYTLTYVLISTISAFSQTPTAKQLYDEQRQNSASFENKYRNKKITVSGKIRSISQASSFWKDTENYHKIYLTATGYENYITCQIAYKDSALLKKFKAGETVVVTGVVAPAMTDALFLNDCTFAAAKPGIAKNDAPTNPPMGKYNVYQNDATGFNFQYTFLLNASGYTLNGKPGAYSYDTTRKVLRFSSGPLNGFVGIYRPFSENEQDPPSIVLSAKGEVPDTKAKNRGYQYGYFKGGN